MMRWGEMRFQNGKIVQPTGCEIEDADTHAVATWWVAQKVEGLHISDTDAALGTGKNWTQVEMLRRFGLPLRYGGGVRHMTQVQQLLDIGMHQIVVSTQAVDNPEWAVELTRLWPGRIVLGLDTRGGELVVEGRRRAAAGTPTEVASKMAVDGLAGILYTALDQEDLGTADTKQLASLSALAPVTVAAHIPNAAALQELDDAAVAGVLLDPTVDPAIWQ